MSVTKFELSIIIPTYNGKEKVVNCLRALEHQTYRDFETIVVIDGSTDGTEEYLQSQEFSLTNLSVIFQENKGRAGVRNTGAKLAKGEYLLFVDDDMRLNSDSVESHLRFHKKNDKAVLVGTQIEDLQFMETDFQKFKAFLSRKWMSRLGISLNRLNRPFITAAHFSIPKELFFHLDGFNEKLTDAEDFELAVRAYEKKISIFFDSGIIGWHDDFVTCKSYIKRQLEYKKAHQNLRSLYPGKFDGYIKLIKPTIYVKVKFFPFKFLFWVRWIDRSNRLIMVFPQFIRYKLYDFVITAQSKVFV